MADLADKQIKTLKKLIETAEVNIANAKELLAGLAGDSPLSAAAPAAKSKTKAPAATPAGGKIIEGAFDGQNMVGPDGKVYPVPANYASKSKLVQGDILKLTIGSDGSFVYKQIGPVERRKLIGSLILKDGQYFVEARGTDYRVLFASVTYFKAQPGDQVAVVVPEDGASEWAAIEALIV